MQRVRCAPGLSAFIILMLTAAGGHAGTIRVPLISDATPAYYNSGIGTLLDGTSSAFTWIPDWENNSPVSYPVAPSLSGAAAVLGGWLQNPPELLPPHWSVSPVQVPFSWDLLTETALLYPLSGPPGGMSDFVLDIGVDNGVFVWLDGQYRGGYRGWGSVFPGEHRFTISVVSAGPHSLQLLREDEGIETGYTIAASYELPAESASNPDPDGDGWSSVREVIAGSDPANAGSRPAFPFGVTVSPGITGDYSSGLSTARTYTHAISGGGPVTINGVAFAELNPTLTPAAFAWDAGGFSKNEINPVRNEGWIPAAGGVTGAGMQQLLGGFTYSATGDEAAARQQFVISGLTPGNTYDCRIYTRLWVPGGTGRRIHLSFINGNAFVSASPPAGLMQDRVHPVLGAGSLHQAYFINFRYTAETTALTIRAEVPAGAVPSSGSFHFYGMTNELVPVTPYTIWAAASGLAGGQAEPLAIPRQDGVTNLLKFACNLNATGPDHRALTPGTGTAGLPIATSGNGLLRVEFLRRKNSGLTYAPKKNDSLATGSWQPLTDTPTVTHIDTTWERVVYEEPVTGARWFARVEVVLP